MLSRETDWKANPVPHVMIALFAGLLFAGTSAAGIILREGVYTDSSLLQSFLPNDFVNLCFGLPVLLVSLYMTLLKKRTALFLRTGAVLFILYNDIAYLFAVRNVFSLTAGALIAALCTAELVMAVKFPDIELSKAFTLRRPKIYGIILILLGLAFVIRALYHIISAIAGNAVYSLADLGVSVADAVVCPIWIFSGLLMFLRKKPGFAAGFAAYLHGSMLFLALIAFMVLQPAVLGTAFAAADLTVIAVMSLAVLIPCVLLGRALASALKKAGSQDFYEKKRK